MSSSTMKVFLFASLSIASALVVDRSIKPVAKISALVVDRSIKTSALVVDTNSPDLQAKKLSGIEDKWVKQAKTFFHSFQWGDPYGKTGQGHRMRADFRAQCKEGATKLINIGSIASVNKYFAPVCEHMQGWHKDLCGKMHGYVTSRMVESAADNRRYAANNAFIVCHDMWWHLMTALKAAAHRKSWEDESAEFGNANADVDRDMQHYQTRKTVEPGVLRVRGYFTSPTL